MGKERINELSRTMSANVTREDLFALIKHMVPGESGEIIEHYVRNELQKTEMRLYKEIKMKNK